ncbi:MAG: hypothetical protein ABIL24_06450 [candidate division WOR-3 bacterium]|jgi:hypothetical protein
MLLAVDDIKIQKKINLNEPYEYKVSAPEVKNKQVCIKEDIKINLGVEKVQHIKDGNMEIQLETPKENTYNIENCYIVSPK